MRRETYVQVQGHIRHMPLCYCHFLCGMTTPAQIIPLPLSYISSSSLCILTLHCSFIYCGAG